jgi:hypothetical protein
VRRFVDLTLAGKIWGVAVRDVPLNTAQLEVLAWVRDGCPAGVYDDWSHRITARALHNRGLIRVNGFGASWTATIEPDGIYYLKHGAHRSGLQAPAERTKPASIAETAPPAALPCAAEPSTSSGPAAPRAARRKPGVTERFIEELIGMGAAGLDVATDSLNLVRRRVVDAERDGRVPSGMRIAFRPVRYGERHGTRVWLERIPGWQERVLRTRRRGPIERSAPAEELDGSEAFQVKGAPRERALRMVDALVQGAEAEGVKVRAGLGARVDNGRSARLDGRRDELVFVIGPDQARLWFLQGTVQVPHVPSARELARARQGFLFPDFDDVPDENLTIMIEGKSAAFWAATWKDAEQQRLEPMLPRILEEILFKLDAKLAARQEEQRREKARLRELEQQRHAWDQAREHAVQAFRDQFVVNEMLDQAKTWRRATQLQQYAQAIRRNAEGFDSEQRQRALAWADAIEAQAQRANPLPDRAFPPKPPEPTNEDLKPFMGRHGLWRP